MPYEVADEIYELCKRIWHETKSYVSINMKSFEHGEIFVSVAIRDKGYSMYAPIDAIYDFTCDCNKNGICYEIYKKEYEKCKVHLERLIKEGVVGV